MECVIDHVKVEMWPALCKFPILFPAMKFKLRHNISQVINIFKVGTSKLGSAGIVNFSQFLEELPSFSQFTKHLRN